MTSEELQQKVSKGITIVDFYATWCQPCKQLDKILPKLGKTIIKVDVMESQELANQYMVQSVPFVLIFKDGVVIHASGGLHKLDYYQSAIDDAK